MLAADCEPFDPYLRQRLEAAGTRVLVANDNGRPVALGVLTNEAEGLALAALATSDASRGHRTIEPVVAAALTIARRQRSALRAYVPPHEDHVLLLLDQLGFERKRARPPWPERVPPSARRARGATGAGSRSLAAAARRGEPRPARARTRRPYPDRTLLGDARAAHARQPGPQQLLRPRIAREPAAGDLLLLFHARTPERIRSASVTAAARVIRVGHATTLGELLAQCASYQGDSLAACANCWTPGPVTVLDLQWLGRFARPLSVSALIEREVVTSAPESALPLSPQRLPAPRAGTDTRLEE